MPKSDLLTALVERLAEAVVQRLHQSAAAPAKTRRRGTMSAAGREAIRAAQKKRWAAWRKSKALR